MTSSGTRRVRCRLVAGAGTRLLADAWQLLVCGLHRRPPIIHCCRLHHLLPPPPPPAATALHHFSEKMRFDKAHFTNAQKAAGAAATPGDTGGGARGAPGSPLQLCWACTTIRFSCTCQGTCMVLL